MKCLYKAGAFQVMLSRDQAVTVGYSSSNVVTGFTFVK